MLDDLSLDDEDNRRTIIMEVRRNSAARADGQTASPQQQIADVTPPLERNHGQRLTLEKLLRDLFELAWFGEHLVGRAFTCIGLHKSECCEGEDRADRQSQPGVGTCSWFHIHFSS